MGYVEDREDHLEDVEALNIRGAHTLVNTYSEESLIYILTVLPSLPVREYTQ